MQGPAGQYHALLAQTWAPGALDVSAVGVSASAQKDDATGRVVVRLVNSQASSLVVRLQMGGGFVHHLAVKVTTLAGTSLTQTNTPAAPLAIAQCIQLSTSQLQLETSRCRRSAPSHLSSSIKVSSRTARGALLGGVNYIKLKFICSAHETHAAVTAERSVEVHLLLPCQHCL